MADKPVSYPNLVESMKALADVHAAIHVGVKKHVQDHAEGIAAKRKALELKHAARELIDGDTQRPANTTGG